MRPCLSHGEEGIIFIIKVQKSCYNRKLFIPLYSNSTTMLLLLDHNMKNLYEVLFSKGSILGGYYDAMDKVKNLRALPYTIGVRERRSNRFFISVLDGFYKQLEEEFVQYSENLNELLARRLNTFDDSSTVASFLVEGMELLVRGSRLLNIIDLKYHYASSKSKVNDESYELLRIYYTSDKGEKIRGINKNMGNRSQSHEKIAEKILRLLEYSDIRMSEYPEADMVAKKEFRYYEIDLKINGRKELIEIFSLLSLWEVYRKKYK